MKQYIGITDFSEITQVKKVKEAFRYYPQIVDHVPMVGVMMSIKTLRGHPTKWSAAWPKAHELPHIFSETDGVLNTLHFADYDKTSSALDYIKACVQCGSNLHAFQFDVPWPKVNEVVSLKYVFSDMPIILQVGKVAISQASAEPTPHKICKILETYGSSVDCVLLDMSGGTGKAMDAVGLIPYIDEIKEHLPKLSIAVAGGLGPESLHLLGPLVERYGPTFSIDAQGKLRHSGNSLDPIDWDLGEAYIKKSLELFYPKKTGS